MSGAPNLEDVDLYAAKNFTGNGLKALATLPKLKKLRLTATSVTDADVPILTQFLALRELELMCTKITDEAIDDLSKLRNLQKLRIAYTEMSEEGAAKLQGLLPMVEVFWIAKRK